MKKIRTFLTVLITLFIVSASAQNNSLSGTILYHDSTGAPLPDVQLELYDSNGEYLETTYTNDDGEYTFSGLEPGTYNIKPSYDAQAGGVTMGDAMEIVLYLAGLIDFTPIEKVAADVDADGEVTMDDHFFIVVNYFVFGEEFPAGDWAFEDITETVGTKEGGDNNDYGNSVGDVQGSWEDGQNNNRFVENHHKTYKVLPGVANTVNITMENSQELSGAGIVVTYPTEFIKVTDATTSLQGGEIAINDGEIRMGWASQSKEFKSLDNNASLMTLDVELLKETGKPVKFQLSNESHFSGREGAIIKDAEVEMPAIDQNKDIIKVSGVQPNPVKTTSQLHFTLAGASTVKATLMDMSGKVVRTLTHRNFPEGHNYINISKDGLPQGIYVYKFYINGTETAKSGKLIVSD
ncbi:MAG: T9SS type A sorting domain-containing protein [Bacteroidales bacterium]|nr:T9SS type A sorting domain-containing protein [Bacteroidales bacterium]